MKLFLQSLFLLFYVTSSYVTTQHRVSYIVGQLERSNVHGHMDPVDESKQERMRYTRFREAKKAGAEVNLTSLSTPKFVPLVAERQFTAQLNSLKSQCEIERSHSRAPPSA
jgi:hypothetical protein